MAKKKIVKPEAAERALTASVALSKASAEPKLDVQSKAQLDVASSVSLEGNKNSELAFVMPRSGQSAYDGRAGQLLQKMIAAMGVKHTDVLMIGLDLNDPNSISDLKPALKKSKIVVTLGEAITKYLLQSDSTLLHLRGNLHPFDGLKLIASFHPADLLTDPSLKKEAWEDLKVAVKELGWKLPNRGV